KFRSAPSSRACTPLSKPCATTNAPASSLTNEPFHLPARLILWTWTTDKETTKLWKDRPDWLRPSNSFVLSQSLFRRPLTKQCSKSPASIYVAPRENGPTGFV